MDIHGRPCPRESIRRFLSTSNTCQYSRVRLFVSKGGNKVRKESIKETYLWRKKVAIGCKEPVKTVFSNVQIEWGIHLQQYLRELLIGLCSLEHAWRYSNTRHWYGMRVYFVPSWGHVSDRYLVESCDWMGDWQLHSIVNYQNSRSGIRDLVKLCKENFSKTQFTYLIYDVSQILLELLRRLYTYEP